MTTEKQAEANRQNTLKSTGPTTIEGKLSSSKNAMTHGLLSKDFVVCGEQLSEYEMFRESLMDTFCPEGPLELLLVEKMASCTWRQRRAVQAESAFFHNGLSDASRPKSLESFFQGYSGQSLQNFTRYEASIEKNFYRALHKLNELQKARKEAPCDLLSSGFVW